MSQPVRGSLTLNVTPRYTTHRVQRGLERDSRDDFLSTTRGTQERVTAETAGGPLQGTSSYHKLQLILADYSVMRRGWVLATRFQGGVIRPFGRRRQFSPEIGLDPEVAAVPLEFRFRIGGVNSLRGFNESEVPLPPASGGLALLLGNVELRVPVVGPFGLEFYMDAGNVWARPSYIKARNFAFKVGTDRLDPSDVRYVFGVGGRLNLPFGPLRVDVSWTPRPDENGRWRRATTQFAIGPSF